MSQIKLPILLIALAVLALPWSAGAVSSTSYQVVPEQGFLAPSSDGSSSAAGLSSGSYRLQGSVEPFAGSQTSTSFAQQGGSGSSFYCGDGFIDPGESCDGAALNSATCASQGFDAGTLSCSSTCTYTTSACTTASGGGGGGGGGGGAPAASGAPTAPAVNADIKGLSFSYISSFLLFGSNSTTTTSVKINGSATDVTYPDSSSWKKTVALSYGLNSFKILATNSTGDSTETVYEIYRRLIGDMTQDNTVNDYDLSKLVKLWGGKDRGGDFNEDKVVNDYDFSMMVARWGTKV